MFGGNVLKIIMLNKVKIFKVIRITAGRFHCWYESDVGIIKKENKNIPQLVWEMFHGKIKIEPRKIVEKPKLRWYQRIFDWIYTIFQTIKSKFRLK